MPHPMTVLAFARSTSGFYFGELLAGISSEVAAAGGRLVVIQTLDPGDVADAVVQTPRFDLPVAWDQVDGAIAVSLAAAAPFLDRLRGSGIPVVLASTRVEGIDEPLALPNNHGGAYAAVEHLIAHGHTRIGFVGNLVQTDMQERYAAYCEALLEHGLEHGDHLHYRTPDNAEPGGAAAARTVLADPDPPTALMVATDRNALGLMEVLRAAGRRIPQDLAVVGFDNIEASGFSSPSLSSVSQRFDEVGGLAARLLIARVRGEKVAPRPHTPPAVVVAARGSCGCTTDLLGSPDVAVRGIDVPLAVLRSELGDLLRSSLHSGGSDVDPFAGDGIPEAVMEVDRLLGTADRLSTDALRGLLDTLNRLGRRPDALHRVANSITEYVQRAVGHEAAETVTPNAARISAALWQLQSGAYLRRSQAQERSLTEQFEVASSLLDPSALDPRNLAWLGSTHVRAGVLAMWEGPPEDGLLRVVGTYDTTGTVHRRTDPTTRVEEFPPRDLIDLADPHDREACFVVPVRNRGADWGLLALVGDIDTTSSRDTYHHWAALLCSAFEGEALERAVRASEERYAYAARATNDGLWEWDLATGTFYLSQRCSDILGQPEGTMVSLDRWMEVIHPDDLAAMQGAMVAATTRHDEPVEVEYRVRRPDGTERWVQLRGMGVAPGAGPVERLVGSLSDVNPRKELEEQLRRGALYDTVTGLPNRRFFLERLTWAVQQAQRDPRAQYAVVFMDLDGFKLVNDSLGHLMGDQLLQTVGDRLRADLRAVDTAARFGGDEFAVLLFGLRPDSVLDVVDRIQAAVAAPITLGEHEVSVTASVGITTSLTGYDDPEDVLRDADIAMYHAKGSDRGSASVFDPEMHARATGRLRARGELRAALAQHQFVVHYQPIVSLAGECLRQLEALVRWQHPERGLLLPGEFLSVLEENDAVVSMGQWLVDEVCRQIATWQLDYDGPLTVSVNVSHREFWSEAMIPTVTNALARHRVDPGCLVVEITESVMMADPAAARRRMADLRALGVRLHIDDFGTGQSSLHALRSFPVDALKIDGSFVRELGDVEQATELVRVIVAMGRTLGLDVVAECVETAAQADQLSAMGCANAQGWLYARALPGSDVGALLGTRLDPVTRPAVSGSPGSPPLG
ncbi:EAL domain-containing protein [Actinotalea sp. K2]|uniref:EAL domain-containing protein n=1 Tax=Actinotalea sp. K2 TaxID=2939438 RepID=UPI002016DC15|nr:EAL domain-containing protein [Actinotalea sp. K2]MCL3861348.1 EAL domain-containing protein [Actinotalea sp. K2]